MTDKLPEPRLPGNLSLEAAIRLRRSQRDFARSVIAFSEISSLLWAGQRQTGDAGRRTAPSAASQYPLRLYLVAGAVQGLASGIHRYLPEGHRLEQLSGNDARESLFEAALGHQPWVKEAAAIIVICGDFEAANRHFAPQPPSNKRGTRYVYIESGAVVQNIHLMATALGLGQVTVAGFEDESVKAAMGVDETSRPVALLCLGGVAALHYPRPPDSAW